MQNSKDPLERAFHAIMSQEIRKLNTHLPKHRQPLSELLMASDPAVETVDGTSILIKKTELEELARIVPKHRHDQIKLPIIILRRMELGKSVYTVSGSPIEEFTVKKILGTTDASFSYLYKSEPPFFLYRPQVVELLRKFHSLFVIGFGIPKEISDYTQNRD